MATPPLMAPPPRRRTLLAAIVAACVLAAVFASPAGRPTALWRDFNAFYCAGRTIAAHHDPYLAEPLGTCERAQKIAGPFQSGEADLTLPAPLPPYALALFWPLAALPYAWAGAIWMLVVAGCTVATGRALHRISGLSTIAATALCVPTVAYSAAVLGEIAPLAIAAIAWSAESYARGRPRLAAAFALLAMCQPHVGLAALLSLALAVPRTRAIIGAGIVALAALAVATVGPSIAASYLTTVLPAHAVAESPSTNQISLTALLSGLGVARDAATTIGTLCYGSMLLVGLLFARRIARVQPSDGLVVSLPVAFALMGGVFMHVSQLPATFPCALAVWARARGTARSLVATAIVGLAVPWVQFGFLGLAFPFVIACSIAVASIELFDLEIAYAAACGVATAAFVVGLDLALVASGPQPAFATLPAIRANELAEVNWAHAMQSIALQYPRLYAISRLPSWISTFALVVFAARASTRSALLLGHYRLARDGADSAHGWPAMRHS